MKTLLKTLAVGTLLLASAAASAAVTVNFVKPENYPDMPFSPVDRDRTLKDIGDYITSLGTNLPQGTDVRIDVLDLDLAGRLEPSRRGDRDIRIMRGGADWPRMKLHYSIESGGKVVNSGDADLQDMDYQFSANRLSDSDPLRYEKKMIDDWFYKTIAPRKKG
jgi:hypothetical protein